MTMDEKLDSILESLAIIDTKLNQLDNYLGYSEDEFMDDDDDLGITFEPAQELLDIVMENIEKEKNVISLVKQGSGNIISVDFKKD